MACLDYKTIECPNCKKPVKVVYGWGGMGNNDPVKGESLCDCGLTIRCDCWGDRWNCSLLNQKIVESIQSDVKLQNDGTIKIEITKKSKKLINDWVKKIEKIAVSTLNDFNNELTQYDKKDK